MSATRHRVYLLIAVVVAFGSLAAVILTDTTPRLGLDLEGGTSVILTAEGEVTEDKLEKAVEIIRQRIDELGVAEPEVSIAGASNVLVQLPGVEDEERALEVIGTTAELTFRAVKEIYDPDAQPEGKKGEKEESDDPPEVTEDTSSAVNDEEVVYPSEQEGEEGLLYVLEPAAVEGEDVTSAEAVAEQGQVGPTGGWLVEINMDDDGGDAWAELTSDAACARDEGRGDKSLIAIVLDGKIESAVPPGPDVQCDTGIEGGTSVITGMDQQEAKDTALVLQFGALPISLEQSQVQKVSPTLGRDSLDAGITAGIIGIALLMAYVLLYYRALGFVVWAGLAVFTAANYALLALLGETAGLSLSLAGIAGLIVSVGVTSDSYIVAFERLKDEAQSGKSMRAAVERGTKRALKTIFVADTVTGGAAVILFFLAVGPVRGFALTLGLATLIDVLVAMFFTRPAISLLARSRRFTEGRFIGMKSALGIQST